MLANLTTTHQNIYDALAEQGYALVPADAFPFLPELDDAWQAIRDEYATLPPDKFLPGGGAYRFRRYDSFYFHPATGELRVMPHEDYFQDTDINAVTGGIVRTFAPLTPETIANPFLQALIRFDFAQFPLNDPAQAQHPWQVDVHQIHVIAQPEGTAHPTPEGVHRDGADFVTVHLAQLENATGGLVTVYDDDKQPLESFQLHNILDSYLFNDAILWHGVTPIHSDDGVNPAQRGIFTFDFHPMPDLQKPE
ncbi:MAG: hypothetical protein CL607_20490 [Anaerolineaceae bacterium]|nr:hypothetical protein [Anaerolineaceae bacterium]